jgi:hypothetical protein
LYSSRLTHSASPWRLVRTAILSLRIGAIMLVIENIKRTFENIIAGIFELTH